MIIIIGSTYAFFTSTAKANNNAAANSKNFEVIYTGGGKNLSGSLDPCTKKEDGINTTVNIKMSLCFLQYFPIVFQTMFLVVPSFELL